MYGISPEDRLWMANRDQAERRQLATADRIATSTPDERRGRQGAAGRVSSRLVRRPLTAVSHAMHALAHVHFHVPTHGAAH